VSRPLEIEHHVYSDVDGADLMARTRNPWLKLGLDAWSLGIESSSVIGLRTLKLAAGGAAADAESRRMVEEKIKAGLEWQTMALTGGLGLTPHRAAAKTLAHYRRKVRANQRRLLKP
jgi:hypothetical protein